MAKGLTATASGGESKKARSSGKLASKVSAPSTIKKTDVEIEGSEEDEESSSDEEYDEGKDVSSRGLARLMAALGEDGLSEADQAQLQAIQGEGDEDEDEDEDAEEDDEDDEEGEEEENQEEEDDGEEEDEVAEEAKTVPKTSGGSLAESLARAGLIPQEEESDDDEEDEEEDEDAEEGEESGVLLDSLTDAQLAGLPETVRSNRMYREKINDEAALTRIRDDIALGGSSSKGKAKEALPWVETLVVTYDKAIEAQLEAQGEGSAENDLKRELEFYKQALYTATEGRKMAKASNLPFARPSDYYAEMIKSDEHMERVRQRLLDERAGIKAAEEAKKQRELKKFGKKVQVERQLERQKSKKDMEERVKGLKRKRQGGLDGADDDDDDGFNIRLESALSGQEEKDRRANGKGKDARAGKPRAKMPRDSRNAKFGFGGKKKYSKENTRESTNDFSSGPRKAGGGGAKGKRAPAKRPGKSKRTARR